VTAVAKHGSAAPEDPVAKGLGVFSLALGIPQVLMPGRLNRMIGVRDDAKSRMWMRAVGAREIAAGVGIFSTRRPAQWVWARVAGDTMDLALLGSALRGKSEQPARTLAATGAVISAFAADVTDSVRFGRGEQSATQAEDKPMHVEAAITVRRGHDELYEFWRDFERFPEFMAHLEDAEITEEIDGERIAWRSVEGSKIENSGTVRFVPAPGDQGTEVHVELRYDVPGGAIGALIAKLFGEEPATQIKDDLRRFKQIVETGEIARS
jgi:uncharacterized membrane protein